MVTFKMLLLWLITELKVKKSRDTCHDFLDEFDLFLGELNLLLEVLFRFHYHPPLEMGY